MAKLKKDYTNWWDVAGDVMRQKGLSRNQAQRYYKQLKALNPGVSRFTRGMTIKTPKVDPQRAPILTDRDVAIERREFDYGTGQPTAAYQAATGRFRQPGQTGAVSQPQAGTDLAPPDFAGLPPVQETRKYGARRRAEILDRQRIVPPIPDDFTDYQLPREQYEYFYGENPQRAAEERNRLRREQLAAERSRQSAVRTTPGYRQLQEQRALTDRLRQTPLTPTAPEARRFATGQYGAQFDRPSQRVAPVLTGQEALVQQQIDYENRFLYDQYGPELGETGLTTQQELKSRAREAGELPERPSREVTDRLAVTPQVQQPYTTDWMYNWLDANDPASIDPATEYMLRVVGVLDPVEYANTTAAGYGGYGGYGYYGGGGRGYYGGGYGGQYPERSSAGRRYAEGMGLVSWRI